MRCDNYLILFKVNNHNHNESSTEVNGVEIQLLDAVPAPAFTCDNTVENANENSSVKKGRDDNDDDFLSQQLNDLNKILAISKVDTSDEGNEYYVQTKESLRKVEQQSNATPPILSANDDDNAESYVKIPVQQLINTFEQQMRSVIKQKVNENVQLDLCGNFAIPTAESKPNGTATIENINCDDDRNKSVNFGSNQVASTNIRIDSQQIKQFECSEQEDRTRSEEHQSNMASNEFDTVETASAPTNYNQEFSLAANNVSSSTYSQFTNNYAYGSCSTTAASTTLDTLDTLDAILDQNNLQRGKPIYMHFSPSC